MTDDSFCKRILVERVNEYQRDIPLNTMKEYNSQVFDILNTCKNFEIYELCFEMINRGCHFGKQELGYGILHGKRRMMNIRLHSRTPSCIKG